MWWLVTNFGEHVSYMTRSGSSGGTIPFKLANYPWGTAVLISVLGMTKQTFVAFEARKLYPMFLKGTCQIRSPLCYGWSLWTTENPSGLENWREANGDQISKQERRWGPQLKRLQECLVEDERPGTWAPRKGNHRPSSPEDALRASAAWLSSSRMLTLSTAFGKEKDKWVEQLLIKELLFLKGLI